MPNYSTQITLHSVEEIYDFRTKVFEVIGALSVERTQSSRIASSISSQLRKLLQQQESALVEVALDMESRQSMLKFVFHNSDQYPIQQMFPAPARQQETFDAIVEILSQKSKEELQLDLNRTTVEKARMEEELNVAKDIQLSMLPLVFPAFPHRKDIDVYAHLIPAKEVGGDFYDFYFLDDNHLCFTVGDVSGKGVPAALMMAVCKTLIKSRASTDKSTASILTHVNNEMAKDNKNFMFVTVFLAILHTGTGELTYTNAGHCPTYIRKKNGTLLKLTDLHGPVIAAMEDMSYRETKLRIDKGDFVFAYSDGIPESHNKNKEQFTDARLKQWLQAVHYTNPEQLVKDIVGTVQTFEQDTDQFDDITALCIEYIGTNFEGSMYTKKMAIRNQMEEVQAAIAALEEFGETHSISMATTMKVSVVVDEILSNIVKYGFMDANEHLIDVSIELQGRKLMLTFTDDGIPFNPFQKTPPDLTKSIEERELGGLGVHLVRELMDDFSYRRDVNKNVVSVVKLDV